MFPPGTLPTRRVGPEGVNAGCGVRRRDRVAARIEPGAEPDAEDGTGSGDLTSQGRRREVEEPCGAAHSSRMRPGRAPF